MKISRIVPIVVLFLAPALLHAADPFLGKWTLDTKNSNYPRGGCPKQMTIEMTDTGHGVHYHSDTLMQSGNSFTADYTANYDERPVIVSGSKGILLPVSLKRLQPNEVLANYNSGLLVRATSRRIISDNGGLMTVTTISQDSEGIPVTNISVYHRAPSIPPANFDLSKAIHSGSF